MKIGIFGNTNNYPFAIANGLRALGVEIRLVVNRPELLHRPEGKLPALKDGYPEWVGDFAVSAQSYTVLSNPLLSDVIRFLGDDLDAVFLNDVGVALHKHFKCPVLALLTGSDLLFHASFASIDERISGWSDEMRSSKTGTAIIATMRDCVLAQRQGIEHAQAISFMLPGVITEGDEILQSLGVLRDDPRRFFIYLSDTIGLQPVQHPLRRRMRIFNGARIIWHLPLPPGLSALDHKGTDVLIRGFADFLAAGGEGELRLVRKGYDVDRTVVLIKRLGIETNVTWLDELSLFQFYEELAEADVVCDQFGLSMPGMVALDAMAMGRPVLSNFRLEVMGPCYPEPRPFFQAATPGEVRSHLLDLFTAPKLRAETGRLAAEYVRRHHSPEVNARECLKRLGLPLHVSQCA